MAKVFEITDNTDITVFLIKDKVSTVEVEKEEKDRFNVTVSGLDNILTFYFDSEKDMRRKLNNLIEFLDS